MQAKQCRIELKTQKMDPYELFNMLFFREAIVLITCVSLKYIQK